MLVPQPQIIQTLGCISELFLQGHVIKYYHSVLKNLLNFSGRILVTKEDQHRAKFLSRTAIGSQETNTNCRAFGEQKPS